MVYLFTILDTILTPVLFPFITYVFYKDQTSCAKSGGEKAKKSLRGMYTPYKAVSKEGKPFQI